MAAKSKQRIASITSPSPKVATRLCSASKRPNRTSRGKTNKAQRNGAWRQVRRRRQDQDVRVHRSQPPSRQDECALMVFKKDLTPIGGKAGRSPSTGQGRSGTPARVMPRITNRYPKPAPAAEAPGRRRWAMPRPVPGIAARRRRMSSTDNLADKARFLRNAAPQAVRRFFWCVCGIHRDCGRYLGHGRPEIWQLYQGHAQQCQKILKVLEEAKNG